MNPYQIVITPTAEKNILDRYHEIALDSAQNAINWYLHIMDSIESLDQLANRCPVAPESQDIDQEIRHLITGHYRILFQIKDHQVTILHLRHASMLRKILPDSSEKL